MYRLTCRNIYLVMKIYVIKNKLIEKKKTSLLYFVVLSKQRGGRILYYFLLVIVLFLNDQCSILDCKFYV